MMKCKLYYAMLFCILIYGNVSFAQDLHFSQYFNAPLLVNPANTGFNPDYDYRVGGNYRNQWANVTANPYKTMSLWGDVQLFNNQFENGWIGVGGSLFKDAAGIGALTSTRGYATAAYHQMLGYSGLLSVGLGIGAINKRVDFSKLSFDNQWNGRFFDANIVTSEPFVFNSVTYLDFQAGINYAWFASEKAYLNVGISFNHLNRPTESFFGKTSAINQKIPMRYTTFLNGNFKIGDVWILNPNIYYSKMAEASETVIGLNANRNLSGDGKQQLILGLYYRSNDAIIPMVGLQTNNLKITANYDVTSSSLGSFNGRQGGYEISIIKSGIYGGGDKSVKCPTVKF